MYKFFLQKNDLNDATYYYLDIIKKSILKNDEEVKVVSFLNELCFSDKVITISAKAFFSVWLHNRKQYIVSWFQGIVPEEAMCLYSANPSRYFRYYLWNFFEKISLKYSKKIFFVSKAMLQHYQLKYGYDKNNYFIMPCFNEQLNKNSFFVDKYKEPSFVYAGSLSKWQCIDDMMLLYSEIKKYLPNASLTLLTKESIKAKNILEEYNVDAEIMYVSKSSLNDVLARFKYGFIIRNDIPVNNVATPTKMSSYMAAGIIPIFSDVIGDFRKVFCDSFYAISFQKEKECIDKILEIEAKEVDLKSIKMEFENVFNTYFSEKTYISKIQFFLND